MLKGVILSLFALSLGVASAETLEFKRQCGKYKYIITVDHAETYEYDQMIIKHYYQEGDNQKELFHQSESGMLVTASCTKDKNNLDIFVFRETCAGSGCIDDVYGLFDLKQRRLLLKPSDWRKGNAKEIIKILGFEPVVGNFGTPEFCCIDQLADYEYNSKQAKLISNKKID